jgi:hypothetical protein
MGHVTRHMEDIDMKNVVWFFNKHVKCEHECVLVDEMLNSARYHVDRADM